MSECLNIQIKPFLRGYMVVDNIDRYGLGNTLEEALQDYGEILLGYYKSLGGHYPKLSPKLMKDFELLNNSLLLYTNTNKR